MTVEARQWLDFTHGDAAALASAAEIVTWVEREGGRAKYDIGHPEQYDYPGPTIEVLTRDGCEHAEPGQWVVKGDDWFDVDSGVEAGIVQIIKTIREFTVEDRGA